MDALQVDGRTNPPEDSMGNGRVLKPGEIQLMSAGTGGTSATIGRYIRYKKFDTQLCVADPENSVFYPYFQTGDCEITTDKASNVEGIGRPRVEASFVPSPQLGRAQSLRQALATRSLLLAPSSQASRPRV